MKYVILYPIINNKQINTMAAKKFLTKSELQVMLILWSLPTKGGYTNEILAGYEDPKPAYTTLATFLKILTNKGFIKSQKVGSMLYFTPQVSRADYCKRVMEKAQKDYFEGDGAKFIQFLIRQNNLSDEEKQAIIATLG